MRNEKEVKLSEYELQKIYFELLRDVVLDEHLSEMSIPYSSEDDLISYIQMYWQKVSTFIEQMH